MISVCLLYFPIIILLVIAFLFTKKALRRIAGLLIVLFFILPLSLVIFLGIFKDQIQQGKILPKIGPLLLLISEPKDLWKPLASNIISKDRQEYEFFITHKYVGNHDMVISFKRLEPMEIAEHNLKIRLTVEKDGKILYDRMTQKAISYWGKEDSELMFQRYEVPEDLPVNTLLKAKVYIEGDIGDFIKRYGPTKIVLKKGSDI